VNRCGTLQLAKKDAAMNIDELSKMTESELYAKANDQDSRAR
jgi:hypothetical protein